MENEKSRILAQPPTPRIRPLARRWPVWGVAGVALFSMVAAFGTAPDTDTLRVPRADVVEEIKAIAVGPDADGSLYVREDRIRQGDTASTLLQRIGLRDSAAIEQLRAAPGASSFFKQISPGKTVTAWLTRDGELQTMVFPLNGGSDRALYIEKKADGFHADERPLKLETQVILQSAEIRHSLFAATDAAGIPDSIATQLADIFGGDIDFYRDLRKGDRFSVIYESITHLGKPVRTGRILATEFINAGHSYRAAWFDDGAGRGGYYTPEGKSVRKAFLRSPLEFSRVTSGFTSARFHPVLQQWRAHRGVDYGAPVGTRVKATADGVVEFVGNQGGYGKVVVLRHQGRYSTVYGHLSAFAAGLRKGSRIAQGDVIAFTGMTGLASGPHLHYEFRIDGVHQNPLTVALPGSPPLSPQAMARFKTESADALARIELIHDGKLAALD
jgi:murein DD-endopeptidase MepM/ murein hydrolase activator NlpD